MRINNKQIAKRRVSFFLTENEYIQFHAYAMVKGFGSSGGIATLAHTALVDKISRNAPTEAQQRQIDEIINKTV